MNNFEKLKSMNVEELAEWLDKHGQYDHSPWSLWFDKLYCKNCDEIIGKDPDGSRQFLFSYCEVYDKCRFFSDLSDVPDSKETVKMWLEAEVEE